MTLEGRRCTCVVIAPFAPVLAPLLDEPDAPFAAWPHLVEIKCSTVRTVLRGPVAADFDVHLKLYRAVRLSDRARDALGGARAVKEFENLREARRRGLPCVEPLAAGRWNGEFGARSFLVTRTVPSMPLARGPQSPADAALAGALLRLVHDRGLHAFDLHPGNVLRRDDGELVLCDLTSAILSEPLENDERARGLAFFCLDLDGLAADPAAAPLIAAYGADEAMVARAVQFGRKLRTHALSAFGRRSARRCEQTRVEGPDPRGASWLLHVPAAGLHDAARAFATREPRPRPLRAGRRGAVWLDAELVVKQRPAAAARRLFRAAYWLLFADVACAMPIALRLRHGEGLVFTERVGRPDLRAELEAGALGDVQLAALARALGRDVGRMHALGLRNRDMKLENLVRTDDDRVAPVDLDGVRRKAPLDARGESADLGRLLADWRSIGHSSEPRVVREFWRGYHRARSCLSRRPHPRLRRRTAVHAREWAGAHPRTCAGGSASA